MAGRNIFFLFWRSVNLQMTMFIFSPAVATTWGISAGCLIHFICFDLFRKPIGPNDLSALALPLADNKDPFIHGRSLAYSAERDTPLWSVTSQHRSGHPGETPMKIDARPKRGRRREATT